MPKEKSIKEKNAELKRNLDDYIELVIIQAKLTRAKYDALLENGFTPEQALELCKSL